MGSLVLPKAYSLAVGNRALTKRIGIRFNGVERNDVVSYDSVLGRIRTLSGEELTGKVEPYWRTPK
jgi:hypothetical protein